MPDVDEEGVVLLEGLGERAQQIGRDLGDVTADPADEVDVLLLPHRMVGGCPVREVGVGDEAELLEQLQRPVDRGDVHTGSRLGYRGVHLIRGGVAEGVDRLQHQLALRGEAKPAGAELIGQRRREHEIDTRPTRVPRVPEQRVVALLGVGVVPADAPILRADDLGAIRGDGIFETMHVRAGRAWLLDEHLARMTRSAARMDLALPPRPALADLASQALAVWPAGIEGALRIVCTRGPEDAVDPPVTVFATIAAIGDPLRRARRDGIAVVTATLGIPSAMRRAAPWLLGGAKTVSYAVNMASQRWARSVGADDVLWVSTDGFALEAPTSTLVWLDGSTLCTVPAEPTGILAGTTTRWLLVHAGEFGWHTDERMVTPNELAGVDGAWFLSSARGIAALRTLDGVALPFSAEVTGRIRARLGYP